MCYAPKNAGMWKTSSVLADSEQLSLKWISIRLRTQHTRMLFYSPPHYCLQTVLNPVISISFQGLYVDCMMITPKDIIMFDELGQPETT